MEYFQTLAGINKMRASNVCEGEPHTHHEHTHKLKGHLEHTKLHSYKPEESLHAKKIWMQHGSDSKSQARKLRTNKRETPTAYQCIMLNVP